MRGRSCRRGRSRSRGRRTCRGRQRRGPPSSQHAVHDRADVPVMPGEQDLHRSTTSGSFDIGTQHQVGYLDARPAPSSERRRAPRRRPGASDAPASTGAARARARTACIGVAVLPGNMLRTRTPSGVDLLRGGCRRTHAARASWPRRGRHRGRPLAARRRVHEDDLAAALVFSAGRNARVSTNGARRLTPY